MSNKDYVKKREEVSRPDEQVRADKEAAYRAIVQADLAAKDRDAKEREERERARRERLRQEIEGEGAADEGGPAAKRQKKKKKPAPSALSFDADDDG